MPYSQEIMQQALEISACNCEACCALTPLAIEAADVRKGKMNYEFVMNELDAIRQKTEAVTIRINTLKYYIEAAEKEGE